MLLSLLLQDDILVPPSIDRNIIRLSADSRTLRQEDLFIALRGQQDDGRRYMADAIARGAAGILYEAERPDEPISWNNGIPLVPIPELSARLGFLAARFYEYPAAQLRLIGVTGTSGKTSCTHFIAQLLQALHKPCGIIGTLGSGAYGALGEANLTTPDALTLQAALRQCADQSIEAIAMEVSSHGIDQGRINGTAFELGIFTNLTQDHLDYHHNMAGYAAVKYRFFTDYAMRHAIINLDDPYGEKWAADLSTRQSVFAFSTQPARPATAFPLIYACPISLTQAGMHALVHTPWGEGELNSPLIGRFNLSNLLAALTALCLYGIPFETVLSHIDKIRAVPGRMQLLGGGGRPLVVVDYAHKPDALEKVLQALRAHTSGKLICVFGCGGNRDAAKRPIMGAIAERWADQVIITNDNPRHEIPEEIADAILQGCSHPERVSVILDRAKAIEKSIQWASSGDCVLIAGKGAEHYQQIGDEKYPFDDVNTVKGYLQVLSEVRRGI